MPEATGSLHRNLGLWHIIIIGLAYIQPMTLFDTFGMVSEASIGHVPMSYIFALAAILLTSFSYGHMIRKYPSSGSAYTYTQQAIHPNAGFLVGWSSLLDYLMSPMVNIILAVIYLEALFPAVNHWVWVIGLTALMTGVNLRGAKFVAQFNSWIVFIQIAVILYFIYLMYQSLSIGINADGQMSLQANAYALGSMRPFWSEMSDVGKLITGATILCFSFTGFDALSSLAEETKDVKKTLPKAIVLTSLIAGVLFIVATYFMQLYFPSAPEKYFADVEATQPDILLAIGGAFVQSIVLYFAIVTVMASGISAHAGVSRLMYVMGRDNVINKKFFGHISQNLRVPTYNILLVGLIALTAGFMDLDLVISLISFGALTAFSFVNLSVIAKYAMRDGRRHSIGEIFSFIIMPLLGFIAVALLWLEVDDHALTAGLIWGALGIVYLAYKTGGFKRPAPVHHEFD
ncbi:MULTISPECIES: APC family permease [unclassified Moraxella]|uniref:APC family permease n=1 Tax=unclassified Moraxella TaxID=2685852 RepID=UPI003AF928ED